MDARLKVLPTDLIQEISSRVSPNQLKSLLKGFINTRPETFRINTLKASEKKVIDSLEKEKIPVEKFSKIPLCYFFGDISQKKVRSSLAYREGWIYLQNAASQMPALLLDPKPGEKIADLCASPGGKTSQIAALMNNSGLLYAIEPDKIRFERLIHNLQNLGVKAEAVFLSAEKFLRSSDPSSFDKILIDAPCSGSGTFNIHRPQEFRHWSTDYVAKMSAIQKRILNLAGDYVKPGGSIVYSTCSLSYLENEAVVADFLEKSPFYSLIESKRIVPDTIFEGFYLALLKRRP